MVMILWIVLGTALASATLAAWSLNEQRRNKVRALEEVISMARSIPLFVPGFAHDLRRLEDQIKEIDQARQALSIRVEQVKPPPACGDVHDHPGWQPEVCALPVLHVGVHENKAKTVRWYNGVLFPFSNPFERSTT